MAEESNSHLMDAHHIDLPSSFSDYIEMYVETTIDNFCPYFSKIASEQAGIFFYEKIF